MTFAAYPLDGAASAWDATVDAAGDVFYRRDYLRAAARCETGELKLLHHHGAAGQVLYPVVLRSLAALPLPDGLTRGRSDLTTPYEYGGPLVIAAPGDERQARADFLTAFEPWCRDHGVVCEFVRFHPLLETQRGWETVYRLRSCGGNVVIDLSRDDAALLGAMRGTTRRHVLAAGRRGCRSGPLDNAAEFVELYHANMDRLGAAQQYYFPQTYFDEIAAIGTDNGLFGVRSAEGELAAGGLFIAGRHFAHYHLTSANRALSRLSPNDLMIFEVARHYRALGRRWLHLGGAASSQAGLRSYKEGFSPDRRDYVIGSRVHDAESYAALTSAANACPDGFFPAYRAVTVSRAA